MTTPDIFIMHKLQAHEKTDNQSRIHTSGQFFPISTQLQGVPAGDFAHPVYRLTPFEPANGIYTKTGARS